MLWSLLHFAAGELETQGTISFGLSSTAVSERLLLRFIPLSRLVPPSATWRNQVVTPPPRTPSNHQTACCLDHPPVPRLTLVNLREPQHHLHSEHQRGNIRGSLGGRKHLGDRLLDLGADHFWSAWSRILCIINRPEHVSAHCSSGAQPL